MLRRVLKLTTLMAISLTIAVLICGWRLDLKITLISLSRKNLIVAPDLKVFIGVILIKLGGLELVLIINVLRLVFLIPRWLQLWLTIFGSRIFRMILLCLISPMQFEVRQVLHAS